MRRRSCIELLVLLAAGCGEDGVGSSGSSATLGSTGETETMPTTSISASVTATGSTTDVTDTEATETMIDPSSESSAASSSGPNAAPEAVDDQYLVFLADMPLTVDEAAGLLANDSDPDGDPLTVTAFDDPSELGLTVDVDAGGGFSYFAAGAWWGGPDAFGYTISDGVEEVSASVALLVVPDLVPLAAVRTGVNGFAIDGEANGDLSGRSVAMAGDVDGDGLSDVVIGAPADQGAAYVVFGKTNGDTVDLVDVANGDGGGFAIVSEAADDNLGVAVAAAGDVNDDGLGDVIVSAPGSDASLVNAGRSYVVFGKADSAAVDLADVAGGTGGFAIDGESAADRSGAAVAGVGDLDGDGFGDVAVAAAEADPAGADTGRVYIVFGKDDGDLVALGDVTLGTGGFAIDGEVAGDRAGSSVAGVGDVDGDLVPDVLVGAPSHDSNTGRVYLVRGKGDGTLVELSAIAAGTGGFALDGEATNDRAGAAVGPAGDIDGDGLRDFIVAAPSNDAVVANAGRAYVVFGQDVGTLIELSAVAGGTGGFAIDGPGQGSLPLAVSGGGDVNGDGPPDVIVGALPNSPGVSYLVHGKGDGAAVDPADIEDGVGGFAMEGEQLTDVSGVSVGADGDINGDGFADLVIGAYGFPGGGAQGRTYVVFGTPTSF